MKRALMMAGVVGMLLAQKVAAFDQCGALANAYGPYDYWVDKDRIGIVIGAHFTSGVETLTQQKTGPFGGDIDYTLRAIPNHPRALMTMMKLVERTKMERPPGAQYSIECYFDRAMRFRPKDGTVRMIYADFLAKRGKHKEALEQLETAKELAGDNANLNYNVGLAYVELKDYDKALAHAHKAYALGFTLPGLRNKLERVGKWRDATPEEIKKILAEVAGEDDAAPSGSGDAGVPAKAESGKPPSQTEPATGQRPGP